MSVAWPRYERPPVIEAVLSIGFEPLPGSALPSLKAIADDLGDAFPKMTSRFQAAVSFQLGPTVTSSAGQSPDGYLLRSADDSQIIQLTLQSVTAHQLRPYTNWETLEALLRNAFARVCERLTVRPISLGVRYINKLDIPAGDAIEDYCRTYIEISRDLPQSMNQYILRIEQEIDGAKVITQSTFVPSNEPDFIGVIMDFDFRFELPDGKDVWDVTDRARHLKNMVFNQSITERMKERFG